MKRNGIQLKEVLLLTLPVLALGGLGVFVSSKEHVPARLQSTQPLLILESVKVTKSEMYPVTGVRVLATVQYTDPALHNRGVGNLPNFNYKPVTVVDNTGRGQLVVISIHVAYGLTEEEQTRLRRISRRPTRKDSLRYMLGYDVDLSRIPKAVGPLTLKSRLSADGYSIPVTAMIRR